MDSKSKDVFSCLGIAVFLPLVIIVGSIAGGWALSTLWGWFIVPVFNLPPLTIVQAIGVSIVVGTLKGSSSTNSDSKKKETSELISAIFVALLTPLFSVFLGWLLTLFM